MKRDISKGASKTVKVTARIWVRWEGVKEQNQSSDDVNRWGSGVIYVFLRNVSGMVMKKRSQISWILKLCYLF